MSQIDDDAVREVLRDASAEEIAETFRGPLRVRKDYADTNRDADLDELMAEGVTDILSILHKEDHDKARAVYNLIPWPDDYEPLEFEKLLRPSGPKCKVCNDTGDMGFTMPQKCKYCPTGS